MKTSYKILWIDDEPSSIDTDKEDVKEFLDSYGIRADINFVEALDDGSIKDRIEHSLKDPDLDMLMVDYHMDGLRGDELVKLIRETDHIYLPVIFYSSSPISELFDAVRESALDGVYIANRNFFINKVTDVIKSLLVKEQTTKQVRGLLMEGVSEVDSRFFDIFFKSWNKLDINGKIEFHKYAKEIVNERKKSMDKAVELFPDDIPTFESFIADNFSTTKYDTYTRWRFVKKILSMTNHDSLRLAVLNRFTSNDEVTNKPINILRNEYAHKTRKNLETLHSAELCVHIRKELSSQLANIDAIEAG